RAGRAQRRRRRAATVPHASSSPAPPGPGTRVSVSVALVYGRRIGVGEMPRKFTNPLGCPASGGWLVSGVHCRIGPPDPAATIVVPLPADGLMLNVKWYTLTKAATPYSVGPVGCGLPSSHG